MATATKASSTASKATKAKPAAKPVAAAKKPAAKPAAPKATAENPVGAKPKKAKAASLSPEQRRCYVEVAAYYIAERRGFQGGSALDDWVQAEQEIDRLLRDGLIGG